MKSLHIGKIYRFYKIISFFKYIFKWYSRKCVKTISEHWHSQATGTGAGGKVPECQ